MAIAQQLKWDFGTNGDLVIKDKNGNRIYWENSTGYWWKHEYDAHGREIYFENSAGDWVKKEYDIRGKCIYHENSDGIFIDKRPVAIPEYTMEEAIAMMGHEFKLKK